MSCPAWQSSAAPHPKLERTATCTAIFSEVNSKGEVLIVEDTPALLKLLSDLLGGAGYAVRQAPNCELALWTAQARPPELILLDVRMPGLDGFESLPPPG